MEYLTLFFPCSILFLAIPYPMGLTGIVIIIIATLLNMGLYSLAAYAMLCLFLLARDIVVKIWL